MTEPKKKPGRPRGTSYPHLIRGYEDDRGHALIEALVKHRGESSIASLLRRLVREEAKREGLE